MTDFDNADHYILDTRQVVGNCCLWWRPDGKGYTCNLDDAGLYPQSRGKTLRDTDVMVHRDVARGLVVAHVRIEHLQQSGALDRP